MEKYIKLFDPNGKIKGTELYNNNCISFVLKYNNIYYSKICAENDHYIVSIDNNNFNCTCYNNNTSCKHIYATLLSIINNKYSLLDDKNSNYYSTIIEYLKIYKFNTSNNDFIEYTNNLLIKNSRKPKFKSLFSQEFNS
jgi:hypothetical protein